MTDEHSSNGNNNKKKPQYTAEVDEIRIKNGVNGSHGSTVCSAEDASRTLLSPILQPTTHLLPRDTYADTLISSISELTSAEVSDSNCTQGFYNGESAPSTSLSQLKLSETMIESDTGVIDYTTNASSTPILSNSQKINKNINCNTSRKQISPASGPSNTIGSGGRLQFFKDGKCILELTSSKDGGKSSWVSVPRKHFRPPSLSSSTVTPTSTCLSVCQKNESSTSLSFSDDNSSIQSSPWQRDHCWKQSTPRRCISMELSLYFHRTKKIRLSAIGFRAARKKRRRPLDICDENCIESYFEHLDVCLKHLDINMTPKADEKKAIKLFDNGNDSKNQSGMISKVEQKININENESSSSSTSSTATLVDFHLPMPSFQDKLFTNSNDSENWATGEESKMNLKNDLSHTVVTDGKKSTLIDQTNTKKGTPDIDIDSPDKTDENKHSNAKVEKEKILTAAKSEMMKGDEKRLKTLLTRTKLTTIVQKLTERKTQARLWCKNGTSDGSTNPFNNTIAKATSISASAPGPRLIDNYQQHVSPRKRILREFEKVSLDDISGNTGGKRCRARSQCTSYQNTIVSQSPKTKSNRLICSVINSAFNPTATSSTPVTKAYSLLDSPAVTTATSSINCKSSSSIPATPTKLYSSYSIHSLLSDSKSPSSIIRNKNYAVSGNSTYNHDQNDKHNHLDPANQRSMLASPKSPQNKIGFFVETGAQSPPSSASRKLCLSQSSPLHESRIQSTSVAHTVNDFGRRSPHGRNIESINFNKNANKHEQVLSTSSALPNHSHYLKHSQSFFSPYLVSPKYVTSPSTSVSHVDNIQSLRQHPTNNCPSLFTLGSKHKAQNIPNKQSLTINSDASREFSPPRSSTAPPRESILKTVPKKTASIRRQFASPSASTSSNTLPADRTSEDLCVNTQGTKILSNSPQFTNRNSSAGSINSPMQYYIYPPECNGSSTGSTPSTISSNAAAAAIAAYIPTIMPPYYHPYMSTLAALRHSSVWTHHYPGFVSSPVALSTNQQALRTLPSSTHLEHSSSAQHDMLSAAALHVELNGSSNIIAPQSTDNTAIDLSAAHTASISNTPLQTSGTYFREIKNEVNLDAPLNLSKH